jgi:ribosomal protein S18 acetylase RimI-like enzyme
MPTTEPVIRELRPEERPWLEAHLRAAWGATEVVSRGQLHDASRLPALVSAEGETLTGVATYAPGANAYELVTIDALRAHQGIGTALLRAVADTARQAGAERLWLITSNDNLDALRFYQRRGFHLVAVRRDAIAYARLTLKPGIPEVGEYGIPIRDELELELPL